MNYKLTKDNQILSSSPTPGFPLIRNVGNPEKWSAPDGCRYLPVVAQEAPEYDSETEQLNSLPDEIVGDEIHTNRREIVEKTVVIPNSISPRQAKLALNAAGLLDSVENAVAGADKTVQIYFADSIEWKRNDSVLVAMAGQIGLDDEELDQLFVQAASL